MLALRDEFGDVDEAEALREKFRRMPTAELAALDGTTGPRDEVIAALIEAAGRGLLDEFGQARLVELLAKDEAAREEQRERESWRRRFPYLDDEEIATLRQAGGAR